jgi:hypothetical protein
MPSVLLREHYALGGIDIDELPAGWRSCWPRAMRTRPRRPCAIMRVWLDLADQSRHYVPDTVS